MCVSVNDTSRVFSVYTTLINNKGSHTHTHTQIYFIVINKFRKLEYILHTETHKTRSLMGRKIILILFLLIFSAVQSYAFYVTKRWTLLYKKGGNNKNEAYKIKKGDKEFN